jgi:hypothetical protein
MAEVFGRKYLIAVAVVQANGRNNLYGLLQAFFIERDPHSRTEIGERDIVLSAQE